MTDKYNIFICQNGHKIIVSPQNEKRILNGKSVCASCGERLTEYKPLSYSNEKHCKCAIGHVITMAPFANNTCNLSWGNGPEEFTNIKGSIEEIEEQLMDYSILCPIGKKSMCQSPLVPLDDSRLALPSSPGFKTRMKLGDLWDKEKYPEPKLGHYDKDHNFKDTEFSQRNKDRIRRMREKNGRKKPPPGEVIYEATKRSYGRDRKPNKDEI